MPSTLSTERKLEAKANFNHDLKITPLQLNSLAACSENSPPRNVGEDNVGELVQASALAGQVETEGPH